MTLHGAEETERKSSICDRVALFFKDGRYREYDISSGDVEEILDMLHLNDDKVEGIFILLGEKSRT